MVRGVEFGPSGAFPIHFADLVVSSRREDVSLILTYLTL